MGVIHFDYSKLKGRICEKYGTILEFTQQTGINRSSFSGKLNNKVEFSQKEILKISKALEIPDHEIPIYFFVHIV